MPCRLRRPLLFAAVLVLPVLATPPGQYRVRLQPEMIAASSPDADFTGLVDEQLELGDPPAGKPSKGWKINSRLNKQFPFSAVIDLGEPTPLATFWLFDTHNMGNVSIATGSPDQWSEPITINTSAYMQWRSITLDTLTRYLKIELAEPSAIFTEIALDAWSPQGWDAQQTRLADERRKEAERAAALAQAKEEALKRPMVELAPFGRLSLVDQVELGGDVSQHMLREAPAGASEVVDILGRKARQITPLPKSASYFSVRLGKLKLLRPGGTYVLAVDYPEDAPRSMVVINTGNESLLGFHTGLTTGDALHAKYVNGLCESLNLPLSGKWQTWTALFKLHERFVEKGWVRGDKPRPLTPEDGFDVTIGCFSEPNDPLSKGPAAARIALYEVVDVEQLAQPLNLPPKDLPHRRIFWREEMSDGVISGKDPANRGYTDELDWFRDKADLMQFLGINTYTKDLLEFGACQHWDSALHGGNKWVHHDGRTKDLWGKIVKLMGSYGYEVLPYYEYAGSRGDDSLGYQKRAKPLTRDDAYTHIAWVENANADVTDPDTLADFCKMVDCTVLAFAQDATFPGVWIRCRSQLPVGFGDSTRERFAKEANGGQAVTREQLKNDQALYDKYLAWWHLKRRDFFCGVRDYLREKGIENAFVLYDGCPSEPGVGWGDWEPRLITDTPSAWAELVKQPEHLWKDQSPTILTPQQVADQGLYLKGLLAPGLNWGGWEVHHARPADDPQNYQQTDGVMLTHAFNRQYTVLDPATMDLYRTPSGLTMVRHNSLNENMMVDAGDQDMLGYFVCDVELAGPYCMMAEALAVANGDPTQIAYLTGGNYGRGFPQYVRDFNANYLALPAMPSQVLEGAASQPDVVVRAIDAGEHGVYLAVVNTGFEPVQGVTVTLPKAGAVKRLATGEAVAVNGGKVTLDLGACSVVALGVGVK